MTLRRNGCGSIRKSAWNVLITPPLRTSKEQRNSEYAMIHSRPRLSTLENLSAETIPTPSRGGLSPAVTRRVCDYIEGHIDEKIRLDGLAALTGLSTDHFARAFHQSVGVPPHTYLLRRRLEHVEHMLRKTHTPLSEIAWRLVFLTKAISRGTSGGGLECPRARSAGRKGTLPHKVTL